MTAPAAALHEEDALGKAYDARLMRRLLAYVRPYWPLVAGALTLLFTEGALQLVGPLLTRRVIDVALPARDLALVRASAVLLAVALVLQFGCSYGETLLTSLLGQRVMRDLRRDIFAHLQRLPIAFFDRNPAGRLITRVTSDVEALIVAAASRVHPGPLTVGTVAAFPQLLRRFFQPLQDLSEKYNILQQAMAASERIFKLLDTEVGTREVGTRDSGT